jgi:hypothetical protein
MNRAFKGIWIPAEVWLNDGLSVMEKLFLVEIDSLDNDSGCFASNAHFSKFFGITKPRCSQIIKSLEAKKLIKIKLEMKDKQVTKRTVRVVNKLPTPSKYIKGGYVENAHGSNTKSSNTKERCFLFEELWKSFPSDMGSKGSKKKAKDQFLKLPIDKSASLTLVLKNQCSAKSAQRSAGEFVENFPHVERWLRDERFNDEMPTDNQAEEFYG